MNHAKMIYEFLFSFKKGCDVIHSKINEDLGGGPLKKKDIIIENLVKLIKGDKNNLNKIIKNLLYLSKLSRDKRIGHYYGKDFNIGACNAICIYTAIGGSFNPSHTPNDLDFSYSYLSGVDMTNSWFINCNFSKCDLSGCIISGSVFSNCKFKQLISKQEIEIKDEWERLTGKEVLRDKKLIELINSMYTKQTKEWEIDLVLEEFRDKNQKVYTFFLLLKSSLLNLEL